ncbi:Solute carrier family 46 member 3 [Lamellibrachia satsuma]|nr:Solute carrier family 46 member 3 [Lamellibrachia satsuma]
MPTSPSTQPTMTDGYWRVADDEDEDNLVNANDNGVSDEGVPAATVTPSPKSSSRRWGLGAVTVEPIVFLFTFASGLVEPTTQAFIYYKVCVSTVNETMICSSLSNGSYETEENLVQALSSHWLLAAMLSYQIPAFFGSFVYGALSDRVSRKLVLLLPSISHLLGAAILLLNAVYPSWPLAAVLLSSLVAGVGGGWMTCLLACFSYLSEVSSEESRTFHIVVVETAISGSLALSFFLSGLILDRTSFRFVFALAVAFNAATIVYTLAGIPEISRRSSGSGRVTCGQFCARVCHPTELKKTAMIVTKKRDHNRRLYIVVIIAIVFSSYVSFQPILSLGYLYVKRYPLSWSQSLYGQFKGVCIAVTGICAIVLVPLLKKKFYATETMMLVASLVSMFLSIILYGVSVKTWMLFLVPVVGFMMDIQFTCLRSMLSKMVDNHELGQAFAVFAATQCIGDIVSSTAFNTIYPSTLHFWNGLCFLIGAIISLVPIALAIWLHRHMQRDAELCRPEVLTTEVLVDDDDVIITGDNGQLHTSDDVDPEYDSDAADGLLSSATNEGVKSSVTHTANGPLHKLVSQEVFAVIGDTELWKVKLWSVIPQQGNNRTSRHAWLTMETLDRSRLQQKLHELHGLKTHSKALLKRFNRLYVEYEDWFNRQRQMFLDAIKCTQLAVTTLLPRDITTIRHLRAVKCMADRLKSAGMGVYCAERLDDMLGFWQSFQELAEELSGSLIADVGEFAESVSRMYDPQLQTEIVLLHRRLLLQSSEEFDFKDLRSSQHNHYTYRIMLCDYAFQGLVSFLPQLLRLAARLCHLVTRMHIEKE